LERLDLALDCPACDDLVRAEIAAALTQKIPVIPVVVQNAAMPRQMICLKIFGSSPGATASNCGRNSGEKELSGCFASLIQ
jgi:hypothetical protein